MTPPPTCVALASSRCPNKPGTSLPPVSATWEASSGFHGFMMPIREAPTTRAWPATAKLELSVQGKQASGSARHGEGFPGQGCVSLSGALPTVQRETEAPCKEGHPGGEEALRPVHCWPLRLQVSPSTGARRCWTGPRSYKEPGHWHTPLLEASSFKESLCCFQRI